MAEEYSLATDDKQMRLGQRQADGLRIGLQVSQTRSDTSLQVVSKEVLARCFEHPLLDGRETHVV